MTSDPEQFDDQPAAPDKMDEVENLRALVENSQASERLALEEKYGPDVRLLAEDDDKLLSYLGSEDPSQKRVALLCVLHFHKVYPKGIVREAADYIVDGDDIQIRSWCVSYLARAPDEEVTKILRDCAGKLRTREVRPDDDVVLRRLDFSLGGPRPFAYIAGLAGEILARLNRASERGDAAGQVTRVRAGENDQDK
jgi:hypothetical protein